MAVAERSWVLRGVVRGFSKETKARASPSPSFGEFGFVVVLLSECTPLGYIMQWRYVKSASTESGWSIPAFTNARGL